MSMTSRSHLRHLQQQKEARPDENVRKAGSRIPTKSAHPPSQKNKAVQNASMSTGSAVRPVTRPGKPEDSTTAGNRVAPGAKEARSDFKASRFSSTASHYVPSSNAHPLTGRGPLQPLPMTRTPSLVSASSTSLSDPPRHIGGLRRKPSSIDTYASSRKILMEPDGLRQATMSSRAKHRPIRDDTVMGIACESSPVATSNMPFASHRGALSEQWLVDRSTSPTATAYAQSSTPSTRYTESPFSHVPTPSSASSYSSAAVASNVSPVGNRQQSPVRSRRLASDVTATQLALPPVRESSTSSSNATVKPGSIKVRPENRHANALPAAKGYAATTTASRTKQQPTSLNPRTTAAPIQVPPEFLHLHVDLPTQASASLHKPPPPLRPSRDNTPSITDMRSAASVIRSDLPRLLTTYRKRTPSLETPVSPSAPSPGFKARLGFSSRSSSRQESPRIDSAVSASSSDRNTVWSRSPDAVKAATPERRRLRLRDSPAVESEANPSKSPRFGIFSRKPKTESVKTTEKPKRQSTRGPTAGTGHEGYGRFGFRGRSGSLRSSTNDFRSPSVDSNDSSVPSHDGTSREGSATSSTLEVGLDDFLRKLQAPRVLRGSGKTFSTGDSTHEILETSMAEPSSSSSVDSYPRPQLLPSAMNAGASLSPRKRPSLATRVPSDSSEDDAAARFTALAARRGARRLSSANSTSVALLPSHIETTRDQPKHSVSGSRSEVSLQEAENLMPGAESGFEGREGHWLRPQRPSTSKSASKWSFLHRARASSRLKGKESAIPLSGRHTEKTLQRRGPSQFGLLDPVEPVDLCEVQQLVQESEISQDESVSEHQHAAKVVPYDRRHSNLLPSPPRQSRHQYPDTRDELRPPRNMVKHTRSGSPAMLHMQRSPHVVDVSRTQFVANDSTQSDETEDSRLQISPEFRDPGPHGTERSSECSSPRHPRLSPVGRIPRVVSKGDRQYKLPDSSFSRPRAQNNTSVKPPGTLYNQIRSSRELTSPVEPAAHLVSGASTRSEAACNRPRSSVNMECASDSTEKNSMKRQGGSDLVCSSLGKSSGSSDSSNPGNGSWYTGTKGSSKPQQEDPWAEYDDLMDAMLPQHTPLSAGSSLGVPFQYADTSCNNSPSFPMPLNLTEPPSAQLPSPPRANTIPAVLSVPQQVARFMQPSLSPLVPRTATLSGILDHYGNESNISLVSSKHSSVPQAAWSSAIKAHGEGGVDKGTSISSQYSRASEHSRSASSPEAYARTSQLSLAPSSRTRDTQFLRHPENDESSQMANDTLRFGALMASKWLSFGQVLFSPAHHEMSLAHDPRVLIIDGLGSDWSYYVALNYPEAEVYNLDVAATSLATSWPGVPKSPQLKLRHIPFSTIAAAFPFPKGFFTAVVLRFPVATTDQAYYACICECKRVLRPGGHLEVAMLDLDLVNMGHRARSVVRGLKTRMQARVPSVSLRNMSDFMVRLIGQRGFEEIKRGVVGVPTARHVSRSQDASSNSSSQSAEQPCRPSLARVNTRQITFTDLLDDARISQYISDGANDEGVTKLVAKVGRWWYSTCYETPLLGDNKSIWQDQELLRECEKQGTSLRLLLCHAQKPQQTRRRTVSV